MKKSKIISLLLCVLSILCCFSCTKEKVDISGYYTADRLNTLYYFSPDGKIYENESFDSYSCYEVKGDKIYTFIEDAREVSEMEFDFKLTDEGFVMGKLEYTRIPDFEDLKNDSDTEETDENS